ncbi:fumarylacetoacetase [Mycobacterium sp. MS1601]|uniref:fumarylacetoacetate hydrolase family protein n=1 Tax=Mycobacterium sp. MS1601 TaxID=1936029 RepID=UPI00097957B4|nr:fumarylacetoacetate hydrolase family protein [Mycobacterium sp. MS1601]AQA03472.1 fumarylacetoacetase [Mycobacterium sp. MS1601]
MKIRRVLAGDAVTTQQFVDGQWQDAPSPLGPSPFGAEWELATALRHLQQTDALLPFSPLSFRDSLLSEQHNVSAARGMINTFYPATARITNTFEKLTRRTFPGFLPKKLFYRQPIYYMSNALTIVPSGTPVAFPSYSTALDFELEVGFVLTRPLLNATAAQAREAIGAFVLLNDFSARDIQRDEMNSGLGPQKAKHFRSSLSETAVTADEILPRIDQLTGSVVINGRTVSRVDYAGLQWSAEDTLVHFSRDEQLLPGELIGLGTLAGGSGMETGNWLRPGDTLRLELDGIGTVEHQILPA